MDELAPSLSHWGYSLCKRENWNKRKKFNPTPPKYISGYTADRITVLSPCIRPKHNDGQSATSTAVAEVTHM